MADVPDGLAFTITGKDIWDKLDKIEKSTQALPLIVSDHETRIRALERKVWAASGFAAALGGGIGAALSQIIGG